MKRRGLKVGLAVALALAAWPDWASAHIGSPDVFFEGDAGPYPLFVTIRPPEVIPGVAEVQVRAASPEVERVRIVPLELTGAGARFQPAPDVANRLESDPLEFRGHLWMMSAGAWQVRVFAAGSRGEGQLSVPVPTLPRRTRGMQRALGVLLAVLLFTLWAGVVAIVGAVVREAHLPPGAEPTLEARRRALGAMGGAALFVALAVYGGARWWNAEAAEYEAYVYKPLAMTATVEPEGRLRMRLSDPGWLSSRRLDDLQPDHGHLMHLFVIGVPDLSRVWHLHPTEASIGEFTHQLPTMPAGRYQLYADVVHSTGVSETLTALLDLPAAVAGAPLMGDDVAGVGRPRGIPPGEPSPLPNGARMVWERAAEPLAAGRPTHFRFHIEDHDGRVADDLELYMGMLGHAVFVKHDGSVFAHVHPSGSVPMAALTLTQAGAEHHHHAAALPSSVAFPYGLPSAGDYRVYVQVKRRGVVETGIFDLTAR
jgi:hypothetical protein